MSRVVLLKSSALVAVLVALAPLCLGCNRKEGPPDLSRFLGTWNVISASLSVSCTNGQSPSVPVTEPMVFVRGTRSHLLHQHPVCPVAYNVAGNVATALPGQTCKNPDVVTDMHIGTDTFTVTDATTATHQASGRLSGFIDVSMAVSVRCSFQENGSYRRAGS